MASETSRQALRSGTDQRPQDQHQKFLKYLRRLNQRHGDWGNWPAAKNDVVDTSRYCKLPEVDFLTPLEIEDQFSLPAHFVMVDTDDVFNDMMGDMFDQNVIAMRYKYHTHNSYNGLIALIQVASSTTNYLIDPFQVRDKFINEFVPNVIENPYYLKIMINMSTDAMMTQSNFRAFLSCAIDLEDIWNMGEVLYPKMFQDMVGSLFVKGIEDDCKRIQSEDENVNGSFKRISKDVFPDQPSVHEKDYRQRPLGLLAKKEAEEIHCQLLLFYILADKVSSKCLDQAYDKSRSKLMAVFKLKKYPEFEDFRNQYTQSLGGHQIEIMRKIFGWRDEMAKTMDENPTNILKDEDIFQLSKLGYPGVALPLKTLEKFLVTTDGRYAIRQKNVLLAILNNDDLIFEHIQKMECHNCFGVGHQGWWCPYPINKNRLKIWMNRPENRQTKSKQNFRRAKNWYEKTGKWPSRAPMQWLNLILQEDAEGLDY